MRDACDRYFAGKHVLVTGGSEGLGLAIAARAVRGGAAAVTLVARTRGKLDAAAGVLLRQQKEQEEQERAGAAGRRAKTATMKTLIQTFSADVTDSQALERAVREAEKRVAAAVDDNRRAAAEAEAEAEAEEAAGRAASAPSPPPQPEPTTSGGVDVLVAAAGAAECGYFHEAAASGAFARQMQLNYMGVVHAVSCVYGGMVERAGRCRRWGATSTGSPAKEVENKEEEAEEKRPQQRRRRAGGSGDPPPPPAPPLSPPLPAPPPQQHILIVASAMSLLNFVGYAAYSPSKWALRGLAEGLRNELQGSGLGGASGCGSNGSTSSSSDVRVTIAYPPDVDTPGYARESLAKPPECAAISEGSPLYSADAVAACVVRGMARGAFVAPNPSPVLALLQALCRGVVPPSAGPFAASWCRRLLAGGWLALPLEALLGCLGPLIASVAGAEHDGAARRGAPRRFAGLWEGAKASASPSS